MRTRPDARRLLAWLPLAATLAMACTGCIRGTAPSPLLGGDPVAQASRDLEDEAARQRQKPDEPPPVPPELSRDGKVDRLGLVVHGDPLVFEEPNADSRAVSRVEPGEYVPVLEARSGFAGLRMADGKLGWMHGSHLAILEEPASPPPSEAEGPGERIVARAMAYMGVPYVWGGTNPSGFDCSGLVQKVFAEEGRKLPRVACDQANVGVPISLGALEAGDRVYFQSGREIDHTGIYMGNGRFIHASGSGDAVRVDDLLAARWQRIYAGGRR
jgi:hypothetical protein